MSMIKKKKLEEGYNFIFPFSFFFLYIFVHFFLDTLVKKLFSLTCYLANKDNSI